MESIVCETTRIRREHLRKKIYSAIKKWFLDVSSANVKKRLNAELILLMSTYLGVKSSNNTFENGEILIHNDFNQMTDTIDAHCKASRAETELWMVNPEYFQRQKDLANAVEYETKLLNSVIVAHDYELNELSKQIQSMED